MVANLAPFDLSRHGGAPLRRADPVRLTRDHQHRKAELRQDRSGIHPVPHRLQSTNHPRHGSPLHHFPNLRFDLRALGPRGRSEQPRQHLVRHGPRATLSGQDDHFFPSTPPLLRIRFRLGVAQDHGAHPGPVPAQKLEDHVPAHRQPADGRGGHVQRVQDGDHVVGITRHRVAGGRRARLARSPEIRGDAPPARQGLELVPPEIMIEGKPVHEQQRGTRSPLLNRNVHVIHRDSHGPAHSPGAA